MANRPGTPVWFELNTPDQRKAEAFYAPVMDWRFGAPPMADETGYRIACAGNGDGIAGTLTPPPGAPRYAGWAIYFASGDVDADARKAVALGGEVHVGPVDIPEVGRFAVLADPQGVVFFLMKGSSSQDSNAFAQTGGTPGGPATFGHGVWVELATPDPAGALKFYGALFGWQKQGAMPMGPMGEYAFVGWGEKDCPGAVMSSQATGAPARWSWYVHVPDIDTALVTAREHGGQVAQGPDPIPGGDYSAQLEDAQGVRIGVVGPRVKPS